MDFIRTFKIIIECIYVLFLPGFVISLIFYKFGKIDKVERFALTLAISISVLSVCTFIVNLMGISISKQNLYFEVGIIILFSVLILFFKRMLRKHS